MSSLNLSPTSSLIISTYNWPEALSLSLKSVLDQKVLPTEVIVADDGSTAETKRVIDFFRKKFPIPLKHVWHKDKGFRLAEIRNKAINIASGDYIIQIDGDIVLHSHFVSDHLRFAKPRSFVRASRIYIGEARSKEMLSKPDSKVSAWSRGVKNFFSAIRMPFLWKFFENNYKNKGEELYEIHGCNMAFWRKDAFAVNGYNQEFYGWGPEDKEFVARLLNKGLQKRFLKMGAVAFHIYHKESSRKFLAVNEKAFKETREKKYIWCKKGITAIPVFERLEESLVLENA